MKITELAEKVDLTPDEFSEILEIFLDTSSEHLSGLQTALREKDRQKILSSAHSIKGAAGNLGLIEIYEIAKQVEKNVADDNLMEAGEAPRRIQEKLDAIRKAYRGEKGQSLQGEKGAGVPWKVREEIKSGG